MSIEELGQKFFTRERVKNRMIRRAAEVWGFSESEMDDFDPLVILLMEACAVEFEKIAGEINNTRHRMMERLAQLLYPGTISLQPAYGIMQVISSEPTTILYPEAQCTYKPLLTDRKRDTNVPELYFSPIAPTRIFDGSLQCMATAREIFQMEEGVQKRPLAMAAGKSIEYQHTLWLGIALNEEISTLDGISFFFNWLNDPESAAWYPYLPYTHWSASDIPLQYQAGMQTEDQISSAADLLDLEFDGMKKIEQSILELFSRHYISLCAGGAIDPARIRRTTYPPAFAQLFDSSTLKQLKTPLIWIEIRFPTAIPIEALDSLVCSINAIPVLNRKLNRMTYKLGQSVNIIPMETDDNFLSVKEIVNTQGRQISPAPFSSAETLEKETYTIRHGINRFDERNAYETLVNLTEVIKEESSFFSSLGEDFMIHNIRELKQVLARLEEKLKMGQKKQSPYPYLMVRSGQEGASISIEYWSCNGENAGKIPIGSRLMPYRNSHVRSNALYFITPTYGGRNKFNDSEKLDHYKRSLLTHERIVTEADCRLVLKTELGRTARRIDYKKTWIKSTLPSEGFVQCIQITITPEPGCFDAQGWQQRLRELQFLLEKNSPNNIPFQIRLAETPL